MSKLSGAVLVLAGVAVAVYTLPSRNDTATEASPPQQAEVKARAETGAAGLAGLQEAPRPAAPAPAWQTAVTPIAPPPTQAVQAPPSPAAKVIPPQAVRVAEPPPRAPVSQYTPAAGPPLDRAGLAREIQRHLKRVGCYHGDINGAWTPSVRRSMKAFTDRVNATLPIEQPDYILLVMVQNHQDRACDGSCPAGQGLAADGRCLPNAIIARAAKKQAPADNSLSTAAPAIAPAPVAAAPPPTGRMALAGPPGEQSPPAANGRIAPPNPLPSGAEGQANKAPQANSARPPTYADARTRERRRTAAQAPQGGPYRFPSWASRAFNQAMP